MLLDLIRKIKIEPDAKAVRGSMEVTSEELGQVISGQLASLAPAPALLLHASGPKAMRGKMPLIFCFPRLRMKNFLTLP